MRESYFLSASRRTRASTTGRKISRVTNSMIFGCMRSTIRVTTASMASGLSVPDAAASFTVDCVMSAAAFAKASRRRAAIQRRLPAREEQAALQRSEVRAALVPLLRLW